MITKPLKQAHASGLSDRAGEVGWLSAHTLEPNFTLMPQWIVPLTRLCAKNLALHPVQVMADDGRPGGFAVFKVGRWRWGLPITHAESFMGDFPVSGTPLLSQNDPVGSCASLLQEAFGATDASAVVFPYLSGHHVVSSVLVDACAEINAPIQFFDDRQRACLHCNGDHDAWFEENFSRKKRKEFRRLQVRLGDLGKVEMDNRKPGDPELTEWIDQFLKLEASGWKGSRGNAIAKSDDLTSFLRLSLARLDKAGKLLFWRMRVADHPVAMMFGVREGSNCWIVKIAHNEKLNRFSPGVLLVLEATKTLFEDDTIMFADSCAEPDHPMIDHLWKDRLSVRDVMIGNPENAPNVFPMLNKLETTRRQVRTTLKSARDFLIGGKK